MTEEPLPATLTWERDVEITPKKTFTFADVTPSVVIANPMGLNSLSMPGIVTIKFNPPSVELAPGVDWDGAAKMFWNAVARMAGQEPPFGW